MKVFLYNDSIYAYIISFFNFNNELFKTIKIPLIVKLKLTKNEFKEIIKPYVFSLSKYSENNFKNLINITNITNDLEIAKHIIRAYVNKDPLSNITILNEIKPYVKTNNDILITYKELLKKNYNNYIDTLKEDSLDTALKITASIPSFLNISQKDVLLKIFNTIKVKNPTKVYEILLAKGFDKSLVLLYVNPVEEALKIKIANEKSLINLINFDNRLFEMKLLTGIKDYRNYVYKEELDHKKFKETFNMAFSLRKNIEIFKKNNELLFLEYDNFMKLFSDINDNINLIESAINNPNNLKFESIENKIVKGEFQLVFVLLSAKLERTLKNKYKLNGKLSDMLNQANLENKIDQIIIKDLHNFRNNRNTIIHSGSDTLNINIEDLKRWSKEIFDLEAKISESKSNS